MFADIEAARLGDVTALAKLGAEAFGAGRVVEAVYWMMMADLRGFGNLQSIIDGYVATWVEMRMPDQAEMTHGNFTEEQRQFGFFALLWLSNVDRVMARNWFMVASKSGNYDARDFMMRFCAV